MIIHNNAITFQCHIMAQRKSHCCVVRVSCRLFLKFSDTFMKGTLLTKGNTYLAGNKLSSAEALEGRQFKNKK